MATRAKRKTAVTGKARTRGAKTRGAKTKARAKPKAKAEAFC